MVPQTMYKLRPQKLTSFASLTQYLTRGLSSLELYMTYNTKQHHLGKKNINFNQINAAAQT